MQKPKIAFIGNSSLTMHNFRINLLKELVRDGFDVVVVAPKDSDTTTFKAHKIRFIPIEVDCKGMNPLKDIKLILQLRKIYSKENFDFIFHYTIKPVIYGSFASYLAGKKQLSVITGLGYTFIQKGLINKLAVFLYKTSLKCAQEVWFLNNDDKELFINKKIIRVSKAKVINGEGINLKKFRAQKTKEHRFSFLFVGRVLWDKGIGEFVKAARVVKQVYPNVEFKILGALGASNPATVNQERMDKWENEGVITYLGETTNVLSYMAHASCIVLPSYREGISRVLLEAAAMEKPIITSNVTGCRDIVTDGVNGFLCEARSSESLAANMLKMLELSPENRERFGKEGRHIVLNKFDEKIIIQEYRNKLQELFPNYKC